MSDHHVVQWWSRTHHIMYWCAMLLVAIVGAWVYPQISTVTEIIVFIMVVVYFMFRLYLPHQS